MTSLLVVVYVTLLTCGVQLPTTLAFDYCKLPCVTIYGTVTHTMCQFKKGGGPQCAGGVRGLTGQEKKYVLDTHNKMRQTVANGQERRGPWGPQPAAADMMRLVWDRELEKIAQRWADQCMYNGHDQCRISRDRQQVGQNVGKSQASYMPKRMAIIEAVVKGWYGEVVAFPQSDVDAVFRSGSRNTGHYTQMVWAATTRVGCGYAVNQIRGWYVSKLVCNYGVAGNMISSRVYSRGPPASYCPHGSRRSRKYKGLCEIPESILGMALTLPWRVWDWVIST